MQIARPLLASALGVKAVTVSGIAAVSVISGQELAERQDPSRTKSAPSAQTQPLADHGPAEVSQDTVTLSDGGEPQITDVGVYSRYLESNRAAIAAYQAQLAEEAINVIA